LITNAHNISDEQYERKRLFGRPRRAWYNNIKMNLDVVKCDGVE